MLPVVQDGPLVTLPPTNGGRRRRTSCLALQPAIWTNMMTEPNAPSTNRLGTDEEAGPATERENEPWGYVMMLIQYWTGHLTEAHGKASHLCSAHSHQTLEKAKFYLAEATPALGVCQVRRKTANVSGLHGEMFPHARHSAELTRLGTTD